MCAHLHMKKTLAKAACRSTNLLIYRIMLYVVLFWELCGAAHDTSFLSVYNGGKIQPADDAVQLTSTWFDSASPFQNLAAEAAVETESEVFKLLFCTAGIGHDMKNEQGLRSPSSSGAIELAEWKLTPAASSAAYASAACRGAPPLEFHQTDPTARRLCGVCHMFDATRGVAEPTERAVWTSIFCRYCAQYVPDTLPLNARCRQVPPAGILPARTWIVDARGVSGRKYGGGALPPSHLLPRPFLPPPSRPPRPTPTQTHHL